MLGHIRAIASLTLLEAWRRKVFWVLAIFAIVLLSCIAFFPVVRPEHQLRLIQLWSIRAGTFFAGLIAVFGASFVLPGDLEQRRIYTLVSKPVRRISIFVGRFVGFVEILALYTLGVTVISVVFIRVVHRWEGRPFELTAHPRIEGRIEGTGQARFHKDRDAFVLPEGALGGVRCTFENLAEGGLADPFPVEIRMDVAGDLFSADPIFRTDLEWRAKVGDEVVLGPELITIQANLPSRLEIPRACLRSQGKLTVEFNRPLRNVQLVATQGSVVVIGRSVPFEWNYLKSFGLVLMGAVVLLGFALGASAAVSTPVAVFVGLFVYLAGSAHGFIQASVHQAERSLAQIRQLEAKGVKLRRLPEEINPKILEISADVSRIALKVVPDLDRFEPEPFLLNDIDVSGSVLRDQFLFALPYWIIPTLIGMMLFRLREFT